MKYEERTDWEAVQQETIRAAKSISDGTRYVKPKRIAWHMEENTEEYPAATARNASRRAIIIRVITAINQMKWEKWNNGRANCRTGKVFIMPWVKE